MQDSLLTKDNLEIFVNEANLKMDLVSQCWFFSTSYELQILSLICSCTRAEFSIELDQIHYFKEVLAAGEIEIGGRPLLFKLRDQISLHYAEYQFCSEREHLLLLSMRLHH